MLLLQNDNPQLIGHVVLIWAAGIGIPLILGMLVVYGIMHRRRARKLPPS